MKTLIGIFCLLMLSPTASSAYESLLKSNVNCQIDLNNDGNEDVVLYIEKGVRTWDLLVLLKTTAGYDAYVLASTHSYSNLSCRNEMYIQETKAGDKEGRSIKTNGAYIVLTQPESSSAGYYWDGKKFQGVQLSD